MNKSDYPNPDNHIFYCDKSDWHEENEEGERDWSKVKDRLEEFWRKLRGEKMLKSDFDFSQFVFPYFLKENFWLDREIHEFASPVNFTNAQFIGNANFETVRFLGWSDFGQAKFIGNANLSMAEFSNIDFSNAQFRGYVNFSQTSFYGTACFDKTQFSRLADFSFVQFWQDATFTETVFNGKALWRLVHFGSESEPIAEFKSDYENEIFIHFRSTRFSHYERTLFENWVVLNPVIFDDIIFPDRVQFQTCSMEKVSFYLCDFVKVKFSNCDFGKMRGRLVFYHEGINIDSYRTFTAQDYLKSLSNSYRQLKRNLMDSKDWTNAGDAYKSEMVITRKLLWQQITRGELGKMAHWLVMSFYQLFSGYQQSIGRPLYWLLGLLVVCPILLYVFDEKDQGGFIAVKTSLEAAFPFAGRINVRDYHPYFYTLLLFERLMSIVLLTFFGLATRARLRQ